MRWSFGQKITNILRKNTQIIIKNIKFNLFYFLSAKTKKVLNDKNLIIAEEQKKRVNNIIEKLVSNKITKYNHQPIFKSLIGRPERKKVLVIEQAYTDGFIYGAGVNDKIFVLMFKHEAIENPDTDIIVKYTQNKFPVDAVA